jgi:putative transposase
MGASRWVYNRTIEYTATNPIKWMTIKKEKLPEWTKEASWLEAVPFQIKAIAIRDACKARINAIRKYKQTGGISVCKFRSRKNTVQSIFIPKTAVTEKGIYHTKAGELKAVEPLQTETDCRLLLDGGRWYLVTGIKQEINTSEMRENLQKQSFCARLVSIDPGVRSFLTYYSENECGKIGLQAFNRILSLCRYLDELKSRTAKAPSRKKARMRKAEQRIRWKIRDLIDEMHHQAASWLCKHYDIIIIPKFETSNMVKRYNRKLRSKTVRAMTTLSHFRFQQFLQHKAKEHGKIVLFQDEAYTSKTASWSGQMFSVGGKKYITDGTVVVDRDYNAARNIMLRALSDTTSELAKLRLGKLGAVVDFCQQ